MITKLTFLPTVQPPDHPSGKNTVPDALFGDERDNYYLIEMQQRYEPGFLKRLLFYAIKAAARQLKQGEEYVGLKRTTVIAIVDFFILGRKKDTFIDISFGRGVILSIAYKAWKLFSLNCRNLEKNLTQ